ncbi:hypothetical protein Tco_0034154 [Tanacetum coccineum]
MANNNPIISGNQVRDLEDDVQELWRIETNPTLIIRFRVAAGLPIQGEIFNTSPYSDSEDDGPPLKKEYGHSKRDFLHLDLVELNKSMHQSTSTDPSQGAKNKKDVQSVEIGEA